MPGYLAKPPKGSLLNRGDPLAKGLAAAWLFNEGSGLTAYDSVGRSNGTLTNGPTWGGGPWGRHLTTAAASSQYVDCGTTSFAAGFGAGNYAVACLFWPTTIVTGMLVSQYSGAGAGQWYFNTRASGVVQMTLRSAVGFTTWITTSTISAGVWYHLLGQRVGDTFEIYINGVSGAAVYDPGDSAANFPQTMQAGPSPVNVCRRADNLFYQNGAIAGAWVWSGSLPPAAIRAHVADPFRMFRRNPVPVPVRPAGAAAPAAAFLPAFAPGW